MKLRKMKFCVFCFKLKKKDYNKYRIGKSLKEILYG